DVAAAGAFDHPEVRIGRDVLRGLKHHVLEEVRKTGAARFLVGRTNVVPEIHRDHWQSVILGEDYVETVRERVFLKIDFGNVAAGCRWRARRLRQDRKSTRL